MSKTKKVIKIRIEVEENTPNQIDKIFNCLVAVGNGIKKKSSQGVCDEDGVHCNFKVDLEK
jgi:hypothetical protein